jgi:CRP-like cAMP-binding protein
VYFIKAGRIKLLKKVDFKVPEDKYESKSLAFLVSDPHYDDYELEMVESKLLEIDDLTNGDCFGEDAILSKKAIRHSIVTVIPTEIFMLDMHDFLKLDKVSRIY